MYQTYAIVQEPNPSTYHELIDFLLMNSQKMTLVIRPTLQLSLHATEFLEAIRGDLLKIDESSMWPGTTLIDSVAKVYTYRPSAAVRQTLQSVADALSDWQQPHLPEDPAFYRVDGSVLFTTIIHEKDAYFTVNMSELEQVRTAVPGLALAPI